MKCKQKQRRALFRSDTRRDIFSINDDIAIPTAAKPNSRSHQREGDYRGDSIPTHCLLKYNFLPLLGKRKANYGERLK